MKKIKLGIIGLGLIGSSILRALYKNEDYEIYGVSNTSYKKAKKYCFETSSDLETIKNCDIVFVCCKISKTLDVLKNLNSLLDKKTIVCDVASIKKKLLNKKFNFKFALTHPMAGKEKQGFDAGDENLFVNAKWLIEKRNKLIEKVIRDCKAKPYVIDMKRHDELCAQVSHLPAMLSFLLFKSADDEAKKIASSGFRDTTRLAMTGYDLAYEMYSSNEKNILKAFNKIIKNLNNLKKLSPDEKIDLFKELSKKRADMYDKQGKNIL